MDENRNKQKIKAIIFDVDGVLIDADYSRVEKYRILCEELGVNFDSIRKDLESKNYSGVDWLCDRHGLSDEFKKRYADGIIVDTKFYPAFPKTQKTLEALRQSDIRLIAYSAAEKAITTEKLRYNGLYDYFEKLFCGNDGDSNNKEKVIKNAIDYLGLPGNEIAIVDDRIQAGIVIGKKYGLYRIRINQGVHKNNEYVPDKVIDSLEELL